MAGALRPVRVRRARHVKWASTSAVEAIRIADVQAAMGVSTAHTMLPVDAMELLIRTASRASHVRQGRFTRVEAQSCVMGRVHPRTVTRVHRVRPAVQSVVTAQSVRATRVCHHAVRDSTSPPSRRVTVAPVNRVGH